MFTRTEYYDTAIQTLTDSDNHRRIKDYIGYLEKDLKRLNENSEHEYFTHVRWVAEEALELIIDEIIDDFETDSTDQDDILDEWDEFLQDNYTNAESAFTYVEESVDGSSWIIYTHLNFKVLQYTDNIYAYEEIGILSDNPIMTISYYALLRDVLDKLHSLVQEFPNR